MHTHVIYTLYLLCTYTCLKVFWLWLKVADSTVKRNAFLLLGCTKELTLRCSRIIKRERCVRWIGLLVAFQSVDD